jgi:hypothetical protein
LFGSIGAAVTSARHSLWQVAIHDPRYMRARFASFVSRTRARTRSSGLRQRSYRQAGTRSRARSPGRKRRSDDPEPDPARRRGRW